MKQAGWVAHGVIWAMSHPLTLTTSQGVSKQTFLRIGRPSCHPTNSIKVLTEKFHWKMQNVIKIARACHTNIIWKLIRFADLWTLYHAISSKRLVQCHNHPNTTEVKEKTVSKPQVPWHWSCLKQTMCTQRQLDLLWPEEPADDVQSEKQYPRWLLTTTGDAGKPAAMINGRQ